MIWLILILFLFLAAVVLRFAWRVYANNFKIRYASINSPKWHDEEFSVDDGTPSFYYLDFSPCLHEYSFNTKGEIMADFGGGEFEYHPCMIAEYSIICGERFLRSPTEENQKAFVLHADWLVNNLEVDESGAGVWYYDFNNSVIKTRFYSGISQGIGISALVRAYTLLGDQKYMDAALSAYNWMKRPLFENGCIYSEGIWSGWIEEDCEGYHILNGHIYSLLGVYDLWRVVRKDEIKVVYENALNVLKQRLPDFDKGYFSLYRNFPNAFCNNSYHLMHVYQLRALYKITNDNYFLNYASIFENQYYSKFKKVQFYFKLLFTAFTQKLSRN